MSAVVAMTVKGWGLATPVRPLRLGNETLLPGRARLALNHPLVRERPQDFKPAAADDEATKLRLELAVNEGLLRSRRRHARRRRVAPSSIYLPPRRAPGSQPWRLP